MGVYQTSLCWRCSGQLPSWLSMHLYKRSFLSMQFDAMGHSYWITFGLRPRANGRNINCWPTTPNIVGCYMLGLACCWMLLHVVPQSLEPAKHFSQQLPTFLLFRDRRSVAQQCWISLHSSSNIVGAAHAHYAWFIKTYGLYPSHDAPRVPTLLGVVASVCPPLPTSMQQLPTLLAQQRWELLRPFARSLTYCTVGLALKVSIWCYIL